MTSLRLADTRQSVSQSNRRTSLLNKEFKSSKCYIHAKKQGLPSTCGCLGSIPSTNRNPSPRCPVSSQPWVLSGDELGSTWSLCRNVHTLPCTALIPLHAAYHQFTRYFQLQHKPNDYSYLVSPFIDRLEILSQPLASIDSLFYSVTP